MALEYTLYVATSQQPEELLESLATRHSLERIRDNVRGPGVLLSAGTVHPQTRGLFQEEVGMEPKVFVLFALDKSEAREQGRRLMLRICNSWLEAERGDAGLMQSGDALLFLRKDGVLTINADTDWWRPEDLSAVPLAWRKAPLPTF